MKIYKFVILVCLVGLIAGCEDFLNVPPKNQRAVKSLSDVKSTLAGYLDGFKRPNQDPIVGSAPVISPSAQMMFEAYSDNIDFEQALPLYLSNMNLHVSSDKQVYYANFLLWNQFDAPKSIWENDYKTIGFLNSLIDEAGDLGNSEQAERDVVVGEMLVHRAYYLFKLLEYFGIYDQSDMGIPVYLHSGGKVVGVSLPRKTHAEVYKIILEDLNRAQKMIKRTSPEDSYNILYNQRHINNLLAQVYWFKAESPAAEKDDYERAKKFAQQAIEGVDPMMPTTADEINEVAQGTKDDYAGFYQPGSYSFGGVAAIYGSPWWYLGYQPTSISVSKDLTDLFTPGDVRFGAYFAPDSTINPAWPDGDQYGQKYQHVNLFQPEEAYLILAEAYSRLNNPNKAINILNRFKSFYNAGDANGLSGKGLLEEIIHERRKAFFANADKRWLDLKRYGNKTITRSLNLFDTDHTIKVSPDDYRYALPIPVEEVQENPAITPNPGWSQTEF